MACITIFSGRINKRKHYESIITTAMILALFIAGCKRDHADTNNRKDAVYYNRNTAVSH
jgi:PBP1b-binding outer membrane lipoprotein LpoB